MRELPLILGQSEPSSDVSRVDRHGCGMACCISISGIKSRDQRCGEGDVRPLETLIGGGQVLGKLPLVLVETK
jgi:hypothetical protein